MPTMLPNTLLLLPEGTPTWSHNLSVAYGILSRGYNFAHQILLSEDGDPLQLRHHTARIADNFVPILAALEAEGLPCSWLEVCTEAMGGLMVELEAAAIGADQRDQEKLERLMPAGMA
ncbi:hypothetical protein K439DRAFT_1624509 [Ramaria rubella]|nr:hypothetical protein K439DRAFT_1624509 [Ramaria rubella]